MGFNSLWKKAQRRSRLKLSHLLFRRPFDLHNKGPFISFTFDDFPRSAFTAGGAILKDFEIAGTYYASLGLERQHTAVGEIFYLEDLEDLLAQGHELGCHTFGHLHPWETRPELFEESVIQNKNALRSVFPDAAMKTFSYPFQYPRPLVKRRLAKHFVCCRRGGQRSNTGIADAGLLYGFFLERSRDSSDSVKRVIDQNIRARGWLIFATHDISDRPTAYGCTPSFFEQIVRYSVDSGAKVLPVLKAWEAISRADSGQIGR
jgi:peptidoglycan/xylan/chitin deacetylase (PgdA/CDA1 family)